MDSGLRSIAFLLPQSQVEMHQLVNQLRERFVQANVQLNGDRIRLQWDMWGITVSRHTDDWVVEESREMAARHPQDATWQQVASAIGRLEVQADSDPDDKYYNEWLLVSEFLSALPGVLVLDPMLGEWL